MKSPSHVAAALWYGALTIFDAYLAIGDLRTGTDLRAAFLVAAALLFANLTGHYCAALLTHPKEHP